MQDLFGTLARGGVGRTRGGVGRTWGLSAECEIVSDASALAAPCCDFVLTGNVMRQIADARSNTAMTSFEFIVHLQARSIL